MQEKKLCFGRLSDIYKIKLCFGRLPYKDINYMRNGSKNMKHSWYSVACQGKIITDIYNALDIKIGGIPKYF